MERDTGVRDPEQTGYYRPFDEMHGYVCLPPEDMAQVFRRLNQVGVDTRIYRASMIRAQSSLP